MAVANCFGVVRFFNSVQRVRSSLIFTCIKEPEKQFTFQHAWICRCNVYSSDTNADKSTIADGAELDLKKKKVFVPRVTLLSEDNKMSIVTLEMAQKISNRRNLKLVKILDFDTKTERPTYKLMTSKEYLQEGLEMKKQKKQEGERTLKHEKLLSISTKISEHDLQTKLKNVIKFLTKKHEVRILISVDGNEEKAEAIFTHIQTVVKDLLPSITKSSSGHNFKIYLRPNLAAKMSDDSSNKSKDCEHKGAIVFGS